MAYRIDALHLPSQETVSYGPLPTPPPEELTNRISFAQGFICGVHSVTHPGEGPDQLHFTVHEVPDDPTAPQPAVKTVVGLLESHASATVVHADGSVD
jgi:hypothetical protein